MSSIKKVRMSDGDIMEVEVVTDNYKYNNEERNDFIHAFDVDALSDKQIERGIRKGWACTLDKVGEWKWLIAIWRKLTMAWILAIVLSFVGMGLFHKIFHVTYFSFKAIIVEWFVFYMISMGIVGSFL